ncbi:MAG: glycosyl hydrolase [Prevotellaceae bacterium]|nr:glycosyl hydrolase [Prevotellaceae bacterium]
MLRRFFLVGALLIVANAFAQEWPTANPEAKPGTRWWWLGSAVNKADLEWNIQEYSKKGIGAVEITPLYGVKGNDANNIDFLSPKWMQALKDCEELGKKYGVQIDMNSGTGWPFGGPNVPIEEAACKLVYADTLVADKNIEGLNLTIKNPKDRPYSVLDTILVFPENGKYRVIAIYNGRTRQKVKRAAPGGEGWVIDHFCRDAVKHYLERFDKAFETSGVAFPNTFFNDSYEVYSADWTPTMFEDYYRLRGYRLEEHIPELLGFKEDKDNKVVSDYRETLSDLLLENFTEQWTAWAHSHGAKTRNQAHGSPANLIDIYSAVDIPEIEGFGKSEFGIKGLWKEQKKEFTKINDSDLSMLKYAASAAHITGKPFTSSETFTWLTEHFRTPLSFCKPDFDLMMVSGVNHIYFHGSCYSPKDDAWPGWRFYASIDMTPNNSVWRDAEFFCNYITRTQSFMQWGKPDNDFLILLPVRDMWAKGNGKNKLMQFAIHDMKKKAPEFINDVLKIDELGYDCDYISEKYLLTKD